MGLKLALSFMDQVSHNDVCSSKILQKVLLGHFYFHQCSPTEGDRFCYDYCDLEYYVTAIWDRFYC